MNGWLIRVHNESAYVWKRKFFLGMIAIPWSLHGGTWVIMTPDANKDVILAALEYVNGLDTNPRISIHYTKRDR